MFLTFACSLYLLQKATFMSINESLGGKAQTTLNVMQ